ncbi:DUF1345 domain-containing protein [Brevibacterium sp. FAM 25378]|uniref:DUF1345 domain-containing protein n=1 Tax=unclassified Brevibacterium TaxID=2614124 RepID=UPI001F10A77F|nr:DUF1345 domain-containing protein [Brevibacterium sp. S22]
MRPKHSQMMTFSDDSRANVATVPAIIISVVVVLAFGFNPLGEGAGDSELYGLTRELIGIFLIFWPLFSLTYLMWTHLGLEELSETELMVHSRWALAHRRRWWMKYFSMGGATSWAVMAAYVAFLLNIFLVTSASQENAVFAALLGLANVIASWAVLVYSFALEFMRIDLGGGGSADARQLEFDMGGPRRFGDYLTFAVLSSTMTAALPGRAVTRDGWKLVRTNVIVAFAFNSVVVATLVSMILSYVTV